MSELTVSVSKKQCGTRYGLALAKLFLQSGDLAGAIEARIRHAGRRLRPNYDAFFRRFHRGGHEFDDSDIN